jgi:hypothetical protein
MFIFILVVEVSQEHNFRFQLNEEEMAVTSVGVRIVFEINEKSCFASCSVMFSLPSRWI